MDVQVGGGGSLRTEVELGFVLEPHPVISRGQKKKNGMRPVWFLYLGDGAELSGRMFCVCVEILDIANLTPRASLFFRNVRRLLLVSSGKKKNISQGRGGPTCTTVHAGRDASSRGDSERSARQPRAHPKKPAAGNSQALVDPIWR